jgi:hypothetical protein
MELPMSPGDERRRLEMCPARIERQDLELSELCFADLAGASHDRRAKLLPD